MVLHTIHKLYQQLLFLPKGNGKQFQLKKTMGDLIAFVIIFATDFLIVYKLYI